MVFKASLLSTWSWLGSYRLIILVYLFSFEDRYALGGHKIRYTCLRGASWGMGDSRVTPVIDARITEQIQLVHSHLVSWRNDRFWKLNRVQGAWRS